MAPSTTNSSSTMMALFAAAAAILLLSASSMAMGAIPCSPALPFQGHNIRFSKCLQLPTQNATLAWNYSNRTLETLFVGEAPASSGWVGWGLTAPPAKAPAMIGTQAFIAFQASNGSTILTYNVTVATKTGAEPLACTPISLQVLDSQVQIVSSTTSMHVTFALTPDLDETKLNLVWNRGNYVSNFQPKTHSFDPQDLKGLAILNAVSGSISFPSAAPSPPRRLYSF